MAAQLGIRLDELQASYAAITIGGVKTAEAAMQIRGAMTALVKPTAEMKKALRQLGYESGEQAVAALGFVGAMRAVIATTEGSTTSIARLLPPLGLPLPARYPPTPFSTPFPPPPPDGLGECLLPRCPASSWNPPREVSRSPVAADGGPSAGVHTLNMRNPLCEKDLQ